MHAYNYTYNAFGQRIGINYVYTAGTSSSSAVVMGMLMGYSHTFRYDQSGRLICESKTSDYYGEGSSNEKIVYLYDETGIIGMVHTTESGTTTAYYFQRNLLGDVIGIYTTGGTKVGGYTYDAWGNCTITLNTNGIATKNPIRYRGYYYDEVSGLYYLNARYYSPEWRRFISPDDTAYLDPENVNGLNLYAYCYNDPVNYADPSGNAPKWWQSILIGVGVIAVAALVAAALVYTGGGAAAFLAAAGEAALGGLKIAALTGATAGIVRASKTAIQGGDIDDVGKSLVLGFSDGFLAGSVYAGLGMISAGVAYKIIGTLNYGNGLGYGWKELSSSGTLLKQGMYQTPNVGGIVFVAHHFGKNGG